MGARIKSMTLNGRPIEAGKRYKVAGWAPVAEEALAAAASRSGTSPRAT